jgi:hypothetical protein
MINHHCSKLLVGDDVCCYCNTRSAGYRSRIAQYTLDLINSCRYDVVSIVVAIKTYEELMQFFTRTCHEEFEKGGFEIGIPWTKLAFEEPFQLLDLSVMYICFYSIYHGIKHGT